MNYNMLSYRRETALQLLQLIFDSFHTKKLCSRLSSSEVKFGGRA